MGWLVQPRHWEHLVCVVVPEKTRYRKNRQAKCFERSGSLGCLIKATTVRLPSVGAEIREQHCSKNRKRKEMRPNLEFAMDGRFRAEARPPGPAEPFKVILPLPAALGFAVQI